MSTPTLAEQKDLEVLFTDKSIQIAFNKEKSYLHCHWVGFQNKESIMRCGEKILEMLQQHPCSKVLNDNTLVTGPWHEAAEWTVTNWFPRMEEAGLKHFAWIFSPNIFAELSAKRAMPSTGIVTSFYGIDAAKKWLNSL